MGGVFSIQLSCDKLASGCLDCMAGQAMYVDNLEENLDALKSAVQELKELRNDVMRKVRIAEEKQLKRLDQVQGWLSRAETLITESETLIISCPGQSETLYRKFCFCSRNQYKFGKVVAKKLQHIKALKDRGDRFDVVAEKLPAAQVTWRPSEPTVGFESLFDQVWSCLDEEMVGVIALYGMGGIGKTTLLTHINNKLFLDMPSNFDVVIWVSVSKDLQIEKIQDEIGKRIGFYDEFWKNKSIDEKAQDISMALGTGKKFVLLLDDIWERIDLTRIGIPLPTQANGCKVVFTTRLIQVCGQMNAHKKIKVELLRETEAWKLFEKMVGEETLGSSPEIRPLARKVVNECAGLPLAIVTIGRAMSCKKSPAEWKEAIKSLRRPTLRSAFQGMEMKLEVYSKLKFSYDLLPNDMVKACFLYCSLFPEDYPINKHELVDFWIGEGFLDKNHDRMTRVRNKGHCIIGSLVRACLLEELDEDHVKMHDVIRDMALWIAKENKKKFHVQTGSKLKEQPPSKKWKRARRMSLMDNHIENLTEICTCSNLRSLFLGDNRLKVIGNDFFQIMPLLRVLDLSRNRAIEELPRGMTKLLSLTYLNLSRTSIRQLPSELNALKKLKCLNLEFTSCLETIPRHLISGFTKLQVLRLAGYGLHVAMKNASISGGDEWLVEEVEQLNHLNVLTMTIKCAFGLRKALTSTKLHSCTIKHVILQFLRSSRSLDILSLTKLKHLEHLELLNCRNLDQVKIEWAREGRIIMMQTPSNMNQGFHRLRKVHIGSCSNLRDVTWLILAPNLMQLTVFKCQNMVKIINERKLGEVTRLVGNNYIVDPFSNLQSLDLMFLPRLWSIYRDVLSFPNLRKIRVQECPKLKKLPLNSNNAEGQRINIVGEDTWWSELQWEDESTQNALLPFFQPLPQ